MATKTTKFTQIVAVIVWLSGFTACKDDQKIVAPEIEVQIQKPKSEQIFHCRDTVFFDINAKWDLVMHGYQIILENTSNKDSVVFVKLKHLDKEKYTIGEYWVNTLKDSSKMRLTFRVEKSHETNEMHIIEQYFYCYP